jgi:hypothetical protein
MNAAACANSACLSIQWHVAELSPGLHREGHSIDPKVLFEYRRLWYSLDPKATGRIPASALRGFVRSLPPPLGQMVWPRTQMESIYTQAIDHSQHDQHGQEEKSVDFYELLRILRCSRDH